MTDIHALEILVIILACALATAIHIVNVYARSFKEALHRLGLLTDFMQYMEREKHSLPVEVRFNYEECWKKSIALLIKQSKGKKNGKV